MFSVTPDMPHNVTVARHSPTSVVLMTDGPRANTGQPITSWMLKYEKVHGKKSKTFFFPQGLCFTSCTLLPCGLSLPPVFEVIKSVQSECVSGLTWTTFCITTEDHQLEDRLDESTMAAAGASILPALTP